VFGHELSRERGFSKQVTRFKTKEKTVRTLTAAVVGRWSCPTGNRFRKFCPPGETEISREPCTSGADRPANLRCTFREHRGNCGAVRRDNVRIYSRPGQWAWPGPIFRRHGRVFGSAACRCNSSTTIRHCVTTIAAPTSQSHWRSCFLLLLMRRRRSFRHLELVHAIGSACARPLRTSGGWRCRRPQSSRGTLLVGT
jgi:hypothetical protein